MTKNISIKGLINIVVRLIDNGGRGEQMRPLLERIASESEERGAVEMLDLIVEAEKDERA